MYVNIQLHTGFVPGLGLEPVCSDSQPGAFCIALCDFLGRCHVKLKKGSEVKHGNCEGEYGGVKGV